MRRSALSLLVLVGALLMTSAPVDPATAVGDTGHRRHHTRVVGWGPLDVEPLFGSVVERRVHVTGPGHRWVILQRAVGRRAIRQGAARTDAHGYITIRLAVDQPRSLYRLHVPRTRAYAATNSRWLRLAVPTSPPTQPAPTATVEPTTAPTAPTASVLLPGAIDVTDRSAVIEAYTTRFKPTTWQKADWSGSEATCDAGGVSPHIREQTIVAVNYVRAMSGLAPVSLDDSLSALAQQAALIMDANRQLSHYPPTTWKCWNQVGSDAASKSNLAIWYATSGPDPVITAGNTIAGYMSEPSVDSVGHRSWILRPTTTTMGVGSTSHAEALYIRGATDSSIPLPEYLPWPTAGFFPSSLVPQDLWSFTTTRRTSLSGASVAVTASDGTPLEVTGIHDGYPINGATLVWTVHPPKPTADTTYTVHITGPVDYSYSVTLVPVE